MLGRVKDGWCWWYRKYAPKDMVFEELEIRARAAGARLVGRSASGAAMGVAEDKIAVKKIDATNCNRNYMEFSQGLEIVFSGGTSIGTPSIDGKGVITILSDIHVYIGTTVLPNLATVL